MDNIFELNQEPRIENSEWHNKRLGKFTASRFNHLMSEGRGKDKVFGDKAITYMYEKIAEMMTGVPHFIETRALEWGNDHEQEAIDRYVEETGVKVDSLGTVFCQYSKLEYVGGSPDGFIGVDGIIEVKCPYVSANHVKTMLTQDISNDYYFQVQGNLMVTGREYCVFISYDPRCPKGLQLSHFIIDRDEEVIDIIHKRMEQCKMKLDELIQKVKEKGFDL